MRKILLIIFLFYGNTLHSQTDTIYKNRFDFAKTTIGLNLYFSNSGTTDFLNATNQIQSYDLEHQMYPVLHFGGLHFWNSTELYFGLPFGQLIKKNLEADLKSNLSTSDIFGVKYYPWKINDKTFRPFVGISIGALNYEQKSENKNTSSALISKIIFPLNAGVSWRRNKSLIDVFVKYNFQNEFDYYISKSQLTTVKTPTVYYGVSYKMLLEGTKGSESYYYSGEEKKDYLKLKDKNLLNSFFVGIGPSIAFYNGHSPYNSEKRPYLHSPLNSKVFLDVSLGYYYEPFNAFVDFAYRNIRMESNAFGTGQKSLRESLLLEVNKFLFDYHGFVPYLGLGIGFEQLQFSEKEQDLIVTEAKKNIYRPTLIFGWDILPTNLEYMTLRTNLRFTPNLSVDLKGYEVPMAQLEFNIIQIVFYPQRFYNFRKNGK